MDDLTVDDIDALVGARIRSRREALGIPQSVLAARLGLSRTSVTNIERGRQPISLRNLYETAATLTVTVSDLLPESAPAMHAPDTGRSTELKVLLKRLTTVGTEGI